MGLSLLLLCAFTRCACDDWYAERLITNVNHDLLSLPVVTIGATGSIQDTKGIEMFNAVQLIVHKLHTLRGGGRHFMAGRCEDGWGCTFAHGEQELHPSTLRGAERGRASAADHG